MGLEEKECWFEGDKGFRHCRNRCTSMVGFRVALDVMAEEMGCCGIGIKCVGSLLSSRIRLKLTGFLGKLPFQMVRWLFPGTLAIPRALAIPGTLSIPGTLAIISLGVKSAPHPHPPTTTTPLRLILGLAGGGGHAIKRTVKRLTSLNGQKNIRQFTNKKAEVRNRLHFS